MLQYFPTYLRRRVCVIITENLKTVRNRSISGLKQRKFRCAEDARHVFADASQSVMGFVFTGEESIAATHYKGLMRQSKLICAKGEAVCKVLSALSSTCALSPSYLATTI